MTKGSLAARASHLSKQASSVDSGLRGLARAPYFQPFRVDHWRNQRQRDEFRKRCGRPQREALISGEILPFHRSAAIVATILSRAANQRGQLVRSTAVSATA